ncbi:MAG: hypothetical protein HQL02_07625 [Nitrospirae bacterium]|nr:hypothetical protein [Nitrospirota bacterium]
MRKMFLSVILLVMCIFLFFGCSKSGAPSCTGKDVKKLVISISTDELKNQLARIYNLHMNMGKYYKDPGEALASFLTMTYDDLKKLKDANNKNEEAVKVLDKAIADIDQDLANMHLDNIRINDVNDKIKKCDCSSDLIASNGNKIPITYTGQFNDKGELYVEVFGLKK